MCINLIVSVIIMIYQGLLVLHIMHDHFVYLKYCHKHQKVNYLTCVLIAVFVITYQLPRLVLAKLPQFTTRIAISMYHALEFLLIAAKLNLLNVAKLS